MMAEFERPNVVVCILCKGSVSVRKGDKTRFFNHISIDHEVHFDLDLFYAISFMSDTEKTQFVELLYVRLQKETNSDELENLEQTNHCASSDVVENMEQTNTETSSVVSENMEQTYSGINTSVAENINKTQPETNTVIAENKEQTTPKSNSGFEEHMKEHTNPQTVLEINSNDKDPEEETECVSEGSINAVENVIEKQMPSKDSTLPNSFPLFAEKPMEIKTELVRFAPPKREKCRKCSKMILSKSLRIHMKTKHKKQICCKICNKFISKSNLRRHILKVHTDYKDCDFCEQMVLISHMENHLQEVHAINRACQLKLNSSSDVEKETMEVFIKKENPETSEPTLEENTNQKIQSDSEFTNSRKE